MNKVSSKLAAGVRKVKSQQAEAPAAAKPPRSGSGSATRDGGVDVPAKQAARSGAGSVQHPQRVWPD
ncbi:MAG: hypothetical protein K0M46_13925 [Thiobacillus sp.]|nr:hypothetical protein [Thiobacillus sp.]